MGMGGFVKPPNKAPEAEGRTEEEPEAGPSRPIRQPTFSGWAGFGKAGAGEPKKGGVATKEFDEDDDRKIRFTIGGVGRRMTKDDFLKEVQKLDPKTRREVVEESSAPAAVKSEAKEPQVTTASPQVSSRDASAQPAAAKEKETTSSASSSGKSPVRSEETRGRSATMTGSGRQEASSSSEDATETGAERRRRLAAFASVRDDTDERETPAERRRREAALGVSGGDAEDSDSDDDNTERVPSSSRRPGIRFADDAAARRRA